MSDTFDDDDPDLDPELDDEDTLLALDDDEEGIAALTGDGEFLDETEVDDLDVAPPVTSVTDDTLAESEEGEEGDEEAEGEDELIIDIEDEHHPDDVEEALDVLLRERMAAAPLIEDEAEDEEELEPDDRAEGATRIVPRREGEFRCDSCFLIKPESQLAAETDGRKVCRDCV